MVRFCHLSFVLCHYFVICALSFVILMSGCATIIEGAKGVAGISTKTLEDNRKNALTRTFNYDYDTCYNKVLEAFTDIKAYIYAKDRKKNLLAVYVSEEDTTPVGIFFKAIDATNTQIEISSPSTFAKEFIATSIFKALNPEKEKEETDVQKDTDKLLAK